MLDQRRRRWSDVVQMLYKYFVFTWVPTARSWQSKRRCWSLMIAIESQKPCHVQIRIDHGRPPGSLPGHVGRIMAKSWTGVCDIGQHRASIGLRFPPGG